MTPETMKEEDINKVNIVVDGKSVRVPKGINLIQAAKLAGVEIPYYCYHPHLSIAGNCRMCQVQVKGQPKLTIGCNTVVQEGMEILTQQSSNDVAAAQEATLEFILINHPLDCTVCDQSGHCKLQDYHYDYNAKPSRFLEEKEHKIKAEPLGPTVMLDGERCIMCTRCIRFCDEVTGTSELGMLNRGDRSVIAVNPGKELNNPFSGTVVDLCPVGALTHKSWRFNTRIWFSQQSDVICPGCSTGCNAKLAVRDGKVVHVKARLNDAVNKEWMCDEGRYGFNKFLPESRLNNAYARNNENILQKIDLEECLSSIVKVNSKKTVVFFAPDLLLEDYYFTKLFLDKLYGKYTSAVAYKERNLSELEKILISPDRAPNFRSAQLMGLSTEKDPFSEYQQAVKAVRSGEFEHVYFVGDRSLISEEIDSKFINSLNGCAFSLGIFTDGTSSVLPALKYIVAGRSILEKSGLLINRSMMVQYTNKAIEPASTTIAEWYFFYRLYSKLTKQKQNFNSDRDATNFVISSLDKLNSLSIKSVKDGGVQL